MVSKNAESKSVNVIDMFWDGWLNGWKTFYTQQEEYAQKSLEAFGRQKEVLEATRDTLNKMEQDAKKFSQEWKLTVQEKVSGTPFAPVTKALEEWTNKLEEIAQKMQTLAWTPSKAGLDVLLQSHANMENAFKSVLDQQQKGRVELLKAVEAMTEQMKQTQKGLLASYESSNPFTAHLFK